MALVAICQTSNYAIVFSFYSILMCIYSSDYSGTLYDSVLLHYSAQGVAREMTLINRGLLVQLDYNQIYSNLRSDTFPFEQVGLYLDQIYIPFLCTIAIGCCQYLGYSTVLLVSQPSFYCLSALTSNKIMS